ncbi:MAG TPA: SEC-C metal-binding domain-containing protein [Burkholderiales bacterium]|nr:SEC-C metal-binding domain-containing protein [Burkholderiales bacterium]
MSARQRELPIHSSAELGRLSSAELWRLLLGDEDRVHRDVIDECARRGDEILDLVDDMLRKDYYWTDDVGEGESWLPLHAAMILGLMSSERAGDLLVELLRHTGVVETNALEWIEGGWPALFRNKPETVLVQLRRVAEDRSLDASVRAHAADSVLAYCEQASDDRRLDEALAWASRIAFAADEDPDTRGLLGCTLLEFARPEHRAHLESLTELRLGANPWFDMSGVEDAYATGGEPREWDRFADPWQFYSVESILERQRRWLEEAAAELNRYGEEPGETYVREEPKIGRNDPCPCGSGKKYKKCCGRAA